MITWLLGLASVLLLIVIVTLYFFVVKAKSPDFKIIDDPIYNEAVKKLVEERKRVASYANINDRESD